MPATWKIITLLILFEATCFKAVRAQDAGADSEQTHLQLCYHFSRLLDCEVDTLLNPSFYQAIYDWLGTPYKYAGDNKEGIDCSGFVCMLYDKVYGIRLAQSSDDIFKDSKPLKKSSLQEGDLVFFKIRKHRISHVGVYLGNNKFAHASVSNGVIISDLDEPYYRKYFYKGGRVKKTASE